MILNQRQYSITKAQMERLQSSLELSKQKKGEMDDRIFNSMIAGLNSQISELKSQIKTYEKIQNAKALDYSLENLPNLLIQARVALGWTQKELAKKLNVDPQQIQRYEKNNYSSVSLERAIEILQTMGINFKGRISLNSKRVA